MYVNIPGRTLTQTVFLTREKRPFQFQNIEMIRRATLKRRDTELRQLALLLPKATFADDSLQKEVARQLTELQELETKWLKQDSTNYDLCHVCQGCNLPFYSYARYTYHLADNRCYIVETQVGGMTDPNQCCVIL